MFRHFSAKTINNVVRIILCPGYNLIFFWELVLLSATYCTNSETGQRRDQDNLFDASYNTYINLANIQYEWQHIQYTYGSDATNKEWIMYYGVLNYFLDQQYICCNKWCRVEGPGRMSHVRSFAKGPWQFERGLQLTRSTLLTEISGALADESQGCATHTYGSQPVGNVKYPDTWDF